MIKYPIIIYLKGIIMLKNLSLIVFVSLCMVLSGCGNPPASDPAEARTAEIKTAVSSKHHFEPPKPVLFGQEKIQALSAGEKLKIAYVYVGPIGDAGWTYAHDDARKKLEKLFPNIETTYIESVPEGADSERVLTQFAEKGYKLIFTTSFGYMDPTLKIAEKYPQTIFMHCSGYKRSRNAGTYFGRMYEAKFLAGLIAGKQSKSNIIGYVGPHPIPEVIRHINAFALGARTADSKSVIKVVWTNSWYDPGKEKEAALSLIDAGADVIATGADSAAPLQAAQERGKLAIGYDSDGSQFAPKAFLTSPVWEWEIIYSDIVKKVLSNEWISCDYWNGLETGIVRLVTLSSLVTPEAKALVEQYEAMIKGKKFHVFQGEIKGTDGQTIYKDGYTPADEELLKMNFFVEGVQGTLPK